MSGWNISQLKLNIKYNENSYYFELVALYNMQCIQNNLYWVNHRNRQFAYLNSTELISERR